MQERKNIITAEQFTRAWLEQVFQRADELQQQYQPTLAGKIIASCFFEPSTRTRLSFEAAAYRLGAQVIGFADASTTSTTKGETLEDTIQVLSSLADVIVLRHPAVGAANRAAAIATIPVINAGDGTGQHPTQSIFDLYTIKQALGRTDHFHITFVGNLKYYRAVRSLVALLGKYPNITMTFVSAPELRIKDDMKQYLSQQGIQFTETADLAETLGVTDVVYQTRMQQEWLTPDEYSRLKDQYILTTALVDQMKPQAIILHPLPRVNEIALEVDQSPRAHYFKQAANGLPVRAALLEYVLGVWQ